MLKFVRIGYSTPELAMVGTRIYGFYGGYPGTKATPKKLTWQWTIHNLKMYLLYFLLNMGILGVFQPVLRYDLQGFFVRKRCSDVGGTFTHNEQSTGHKGPQPEILWRKEVAGVIFWGPPILRRIKVDANFYGFCWGGMGGLFLCIGLKFMTPEVAGGTWINWFENWTQRLWD